MVWPAFEMLLLPELEQEKFCRDILKSLLDPANELWLHTLDVFFQMDRGTAPTADKLFIHRNTLVYRLDKLQKSTGLDLRVFEDAITFKIALMVVRYMKYMESFEY